MGVCTVCGVLFGCFWGVAVRFLKVLGLYCALLSLFLAVGHAVLPSQLAGLVALLVPPILTWRMVRGWGQSQAHSQAGGVTLRKESPRQAGVGGGAVRGRATGGRPRGRGWISPYESVTVGGTVIGGMVYVGNPPSAETPYGAREKLRPYIDPSLPVAPKGRDRAGASLPYWPSYSEITPTCRATYLEWLATGRCDPSYDAGYMFLYFYGLERRYFVDRPAADERQKIIAEVARLKDLYADSGSVCRYLGAFLERAPLLEAEDQILSIPPLEGGGWAVPVPVQIAIGVMLDRRQALTADWLLSWFVYHPERSLRTPADRCREEFRALFRHGFAARFPSGLKLDRPRKSLTVVYEAASGEFSVDLSPRVEGKPVPDISGLRKGIEIAQELADEAMTALEKYSRFLGRNPGARGSVEAHALLPTSLWDQFPSDGMQALRAWAQEQIIAGGLVPLVEVLARLRGDVPAAVGKRHLTDAADALGRIGIGLAPDPRFSLRAPKHGEAVVLFALEGPVSRLEEVSAAYQRALLELALAVFIAQADGQVSGQERQALDQLIRRTSGLNTAERLRLSANLDWLLAVPPDLPFLRRKVKDMTVEQQAAVRAAIVTVAHADAVMHAAEVAQIERLYKAMGLDPAVAYSDLQAPVPAAGPVTVLAFEPSPDGEVILPEEVPAAGVPRLDAVRIAAIQQDTARVSSVLGQIFAMPEEDGPPEAEEEKEISGWRGLDPKHTALLRELLTRDHWREDAFAALARGYGLMASGALETLNEWAFEQFEEALLEEYDGYGVVASLAVPLRTELQGGEG